MASKIVTIGGGGGHSQVLKALKTLPNLAITAICPSTDSGGSTGILKKEYQAPGHLGDLTRCIAALCPDASLTKKLSRRYTRGFLAGHSSKNLLFFSLKQLMSEEKALREIYRICKLGEHRVIPVSQRSAELHALLLVGDHPILGEANIDNLSKNPLWNPGVHSIQGLWLHPKIHASEKALKAIEEALEVVVCPGDLFTSILPTLLPEGMMGALQTTSARITIVLNLVTKRGETDGYYAENFWERIEKEMGRKCNILIYNSKKVPRRVLAEYRVENKTPVTLSGAAAACSLEGRELMIAPLLSVDEKNQLCHDPEALAKVFKRIFRS